MKTKASLLITTKCNLILALRNYHDINLSMALYKAGKAVLDNLYNTEIKQSIIDDVALTYGVTVPEVQQYIATGRIVFIDAIDNYIAQEKMDRNNYN